MARRLTRQLTTGNGQLTLNICHLYPDLMDTYGDKGNIITLVKRCQWRGINVRVSNIGVGQSLDFSAKGGPASGWDLYFFGGGQDRQQQIVGQDLQKKAEDIKCAIENGTVLLSICGGYQLLQNHFKTLDGKMIKGIGLFNANTVGSTTRMIQGLLIELNPELKNQILSIYPDTRYQIPDTILLFSSAEKIGMTTNLKIIFSKKFWPIINGTVLRNRFLCPLKSGKRKLI